MGGGGVGVVREKENHYCKDKIYRVRVLELQFLAIFGQYSFQQYFFGSLDKVHTKGVMQRSALLWVLFRPTFLSVRNSCVSVLYDLLKTD